MMTSTRNRMMQPLMLGDRTAADLMTTNPRSLRQDATVAEAAAFLCTRGFSAAPVIDEAGRPVGVVSGTDLIHRHGQMAVGRPASRRGSGKGAADLGGETPVRNVMTPAVFCVHADTPAVKLVEKMLALNVRRLFVVDDENVLVGVVSAFDVLRGLKHPFRAGG